MWIAQVAQKLGFHVAADAPMFFGKRMRVITGESVSRTLLAFGYTECALSALMLRLLRPGDAVVDVGAHFGYEAMLASVAVGPSGKVYSFEPNPVAFVLARHNLRRFAQCELFALGVADKPGTLRLQNRPVEQSAFNSFEQDSAVEDFVDVSVTILDHALADRQRPIALLKCDADGFELPVLRGAQQILQDDRPTLVLEADMRDRPTEATPRTRELIDYFAASDYRLFDFEFDGQLRIGPVGSLSVSHANVAFVPSERAKAFALLGGGRLTTS